MSERFGSYEIYEELGAGGIASVHLARSPAIKNPVALKRLYPHIASVRELVGSFIEEARIARFLRHPGIARVYEFGRLRGTYFIVFDFVPGPTLQQLHQHCIAHVGRIPIPVVLEIIYQLCDALDHAHTVKNELGIPLGIVHRDVSPSNVIVSTSGQVMLIDFGLAKTKLSSVNSQVGVIKGKLNYVAPEYLTSGKVDARCDLWALGVMMYELLTNRRLFDAPDQGTILERVQKMPIPAPSLANPDVPPGVDKIVLGALDRNPERRWQRASEMREAIANTATTRLTKQQLVTWVEWAFSQKQPPRDEGSAASALHEMLRSEQIEIVGDLPAISAAMKVRRLESIASMPTSAAMLSQRSTPRWLPIVLVALVVFVGVGLARLLGAF